MTRLEKMNRDRFIVFERRARERTKIRQKLTLVFMLCCMIDETLTSRERKSFDDSSSSWSSPDSFHYLRISFDEFLCCSSSAWWMIRFSFRCRRRRRNCNQIHLKFERVIHLAAALSLNANWMFFLTLFFSSSASKHSFTLVVETFSCSPQLHQKKKRVQVRWCFPSKFIQISRFLFLSPIRS